MNMETILNKIDKYLVIKEKEERISLSIDKKIDLNEAIKIIKKSKDKEKDISMFSENIKEEIKELIEGGII